MNMNPVVRDSDLYFFTRYAKRELENDHAERMCRADGSLDVMSTKPIERLRKANLMDLIRETSR